MNGSQFLNATTLEGDLFADIDVKERVQYESSHNTIDYELYFLILRFIVRIILGVVAVSADLFLAITICRFKRLKTRTNMYILNLSILNIFCFVSTPTYLVSVCFMGCFTPVIIFLQVQITLQILYLIFALGLAVDWFTSSVRSTLIQKYHKVYKIFFVCVYIFSIVEFAIALTYSEVTHEYRTLVYVIFYVIVLFVFIILNIAKWCKNSDLPTDCLKTYYAFTISNIIVFSSLPLLIYHILFFVSFDFWTSYFSMFLSFTEFVPEYIACGHPILVVYLLGKFNKHFKSAYKKSFKRSVKTYHTDNLDDASEDESKTGNNAV